MRIKGNRCWLVKSESGSTITIIIKCDAVPLIESLPIIRDKGFYTIVTLLGRDKRYLSIL